MSKIALILGEPASGKTYSIRNLNPSKTFIINVLNKSFPFKGWEKIPFSHPNLEGKWNYLSTDNYTTIRNILKLINEKRKDIETIIIDDFQYIMCNEFMKRASEKGFEKFTEIGQHTWLILQDIMNLRDDLFCFVLSHTMTDENGRVKLKTIGKMMENYMTIEGMFPIILHSMIKDNKYIFLCNDDGKHVARSPINLFEKYIDNDLSFVQKKIDDYYKIDEDIPQ